jgi:hypothetical protein
MAFARVDGRHFLLVLCRGVDEVMVFDPLAGHKLKPLKTTYDQWYLVDIAAPGDMAAVLSAGKLSEGGLNEVFVSRLHVNVPGSKSLHWTLLRRLVVGVGQWYQGYQAQVAFSRDGTELAYEVYDTVLGEWRLSVTSVKTPSPCALLPLPTLCHDHKLEHFMGRWVYCRHGAELENDLQLSPATVAMVTCPGRTHAVTEDLGILFCTSGSWNVATCADKAAMFLMSPDRVAWMVAVHRGLVHRMAQVQPKPRLGSRRRRH